MCGQIQRNHKGAAQADVRELVRGQEYPRFVNLSGLASPTEIATATRIPGPTVNRLQS